MNQFKTLMTALFAVLPTIASAVSVTVTIEAPGVQVANLAGIGATGALVETFDDTSTGGFTNYQSVLGSYSAVQVNSADQYGGANESQYLFVRSSPGSTLTLQSPAKYLGFWWSAGNGSNRIDLLSGGQVVFSFNTDDVVTFINGNAADPSAYYGNPNPGFLGRVGHEPFAFINMFADAPFDAVTFSGGNFETDNHTTAVNYTAFKGYSIAPAPVPLPASLALFSGALGAFAFLAGRRRDA